MVLKTYAPRASIAVRISASWRANARPIASRSRSQRTVLPSISENRNVTVPVGRAEAGGPEFTASPWLARFVLGAFPSAEHLYQRPAMSWVRHLRARRMREQAARNSSVAFAIAFNG